MANSFSSQISDWAKKTNTAQTDVLHESVRLMVDEVTRPEGAGGHLPVVTGNLRNSVAVSTSGPVTVDFKRKKFSNPDDAVNNAVADIDVGETAWIGFRAPYAHKVEAKRGFVRLAAQRWPLIVDQANQKISGR